MDFSRESEPLVRAATAGNEGISHVFNSIHLIYRSERLIKCLFFHYGEVSSKCLIKEASSTEISLQSMCSINIPHSKESKVKKSLFTSKVAHPCR